MCVLLLCIATSICDADQSELVKPLVVPDKKREQTMPVAIAVAFVIGATVVT